MDSAGVPGERAIVSDNAVTRNNDRNSVVVIRHSHSARSSGLAQLFRDLAIRAGFTVGNLEQFPPDGHLKWGAVQVEREIEPGALLLEVFLKLGDENAICLDVHNSALWNAASEMKRSQT